jgi:hypothetical protein
MARNTAVEMKQVALKRKLNEPAISSGEEEVA